MKWFCLAPAFAINILLKSTIFIFNIYDETSGVHCYYETRSSSTLSLSLRPSSLTNHGLYGRSPTAQGGQPTWMTFTRFIAIIVAFRLLFFHGNILFSRNIIVHKLIFAQSTLVKATFHRRSQMKRDSILSTSRTNFRRSQATAFDWIIGRTRAVGRTIPARPAIAVIILANRRYAESRMTVTAENCRLHSHSCQISCLLYNLPASIFLVEIMILKLTVY